MKAISRPKSRFRKKFSYLRYQKTFIEIGCNLRVDLTQGTFLNVEAYVRYMYVACHHWRNKNDNLAQKHRSLYSRSAALGPILGVII